MSCTFRQRFVLVAICLAGGGGALAQTNHPAIQRAQDDLVQAREIAASVTNEAERAMWLRRIALGEKEVESARKRAELEQREQDVLRSTQGVRRLLRDALRGVETDTETYAKRLQELDREIRRLKGVLSYEAPAKPDAADNDQSLQTRVEAEQRRRDLTDEIRTKELDRFAIDLRLRLVREAEAIDKALGEEEARPRPNIRRITERRHRCEEAAKAVEEYQSRMDLLKSERDGVQESIALCQERSTNLSEEVATLDHLYATNRRSIFSIGQTQDPAQKIRQEHVRQALFEAKGQQKGLQQRQNNLERQLGSIEECLGLLEQGAALHRRATAYWTEQRLDMLHRYLNELLFPLLLIGMVLLGYVLISRTLFQFAFRGETRFIARRVGTYVTGLIVLGILASFFLEDLRSIATVLGIAGAAVVIALQDLCSSFAGWFVIIFSRKIRVGDRVEIDGRKGDVIDIQMLRTTLLEIDNGLGEDEPTGRIIVIPNSFIFKLQFCNYAHIHPHIWGKTEVTVTVESPAKQVYDLLQRLLQEETREEFETARQAATGMERQYGVPDAEYQPRVTMAIEPSGVRFTLFFVSHYRTLTKTRNKIIHRMLMEFERDPHIRLAYPAQREMEYPNPVSYHKPGPTRPG